ncbi:MAG: hypothetical protein RLZZ175_3175 [Bacteroidota bacterium]|jgi:uncharacterized protein (TIGR02145 family)
MKKQLLTIVALCFSYFATAQVGVGTTTPHASAVLDVTSTTQGFLPPRMTQAQRDAIASPAAGLIIWCTNCGASGELQIYNSTIWSNLSLGGSQVGTISSITCGSATNNGTLVSGIVASSVSSEIPYSGGNSGTHDGQTVTSTGVTGLTATLSGGVFASSGNLTYTITGTPASSGTATFALNIGGQSCNLTRTVNAGLISTITCGSATNNGTLTSGTAASGVNSVVPYTGGNAGSHNGQTVTSTGITGLTATLSAGTFASGSGSVTYTITGTPSGAGTATFALNIGGQTCSLTRTVNAPSIPGNVTCTGATISATSCASVSGATINDVGATTLGTEYNWTGATTSGMANTSTTQALVEIGGQCWMRYNMDVTPSTGLNWYFNGGPYINEGRLYNWYAAMNGATTERAQGICPTGWHIPSNCEWMYLENTLGMTTADQQFTGSGYRNSGDVGYDLSSAVSGGTNNSGFSGLLGGYRNENGTWYRTLTGHWWLSSASGTNALRTKLETGIRGVDKNYNEKGEYGFSVRCLKD